MAPSPSLWVFLFDTDHLSPAGLTHSRDAVIKFIAEKLHRGDIGGVVAEGKLANNRMTSDHDELKAAAAAVKQPGSLRSRQLEMTREWPRLQDELEIIRIAVDRDKETLQRASIRACSDDPDECKRVPPDLAVVEKADRLYGDIRRAALNTLASVEALSNGLARMEGPKTVVFLSEGFVAERLEASMRAAVGDAARAGAHFYTIDARGLNTGALATLVDRPYAENSAGPASHFDTQADGINSLAVDTGGFAIRNENNLARALDQIQQDAGVYYVVSYTPSNAAFDGKYRRIDVNVDRTGVKVRARRGYLALPPAALLRPVAIRSTIPPPDLPVSPGLLALPDPVDLTDNVPLVARAATPTAGGAVRARIDGGAMVAALGRNEAGGGSAAETGWAAYQRGDVVAAAAHLAVAANAPDARPWVRYALGLAEFAQQRYAEAAAAWERVVRDAPDFEPTYFSLADAYGLQKDNGATLKVLREAQRRWPEDPEVYDAIGVIQIKRGALDAAVDSFDQATKVAATDALGWFNLGRALQMRWVKSQRYDRESQRWIGPGDDRKRAVDAYQKCLDIGGPYDAQARQALSALAWR